MLFKNTFIFYFFLISSVQGQHLFVAEMNYFSGKGIAHTPDFSPEIKGWTNAFGISIGKQSDGSKQWQKRWKLPDYGVSFLYQSNASKAAFGSTYALFLFGQFPLIRKERYTIFSKMSYGMAYVSKYNSPENEINNAIGTPLNVFVGIDFITEIKITDHLGINIGLGFNHFSNGAFKKPNLGLNTPLATLGLKYRVSKLEYEKISKKDIDKPKNKDEYLAKFGFGIGQIGGKGTPQYPIYIFSLAYARYTSVANKMIMGLQFELDEKVGKNLIQRSSDSIPKLAKPFTSSLYFADEMLLGHFALHFEGGVYLWHPHWKANPIYFKAGPFFYTPEFGKKTNSQFFIGTYVKTHFGTAQFIGADLGFVFR